MSSIVRDLVGWCRDAALPLWATAGRDPAGGFHERLWPDGRPDEAAIRRVRVQARQVYVYAQAACLGWYPAGVEVAMHGFRQLRDRARSPDGRPGFVHLLKPDGSVHDARRDSYDHAFILLGLGWLLKAGGGADVRALFDETRAFVEQTLSEPDGSVLEGVPHILPRRQNPQMHLFEAMLALHETIGHPDALARAATLRRLFEDQFVDPASGTLGELFTQDWAPLPGPDGDVVEPGHMVEWTWLLRRHDRLAGLPRSSLPRRLLDTILPTAEAGTGFLIDETDRSGRPRRATRRCWPQTELAKAWIAESEVSAADARPRAEEVLLALRNHYLQPKGEGSPVAGGWVDQYDGEGRLISTDMPASTFYHVFCAIAEADRVLG